MLGPRIGKFDKNGRPKVISGHSMPLAALGVLILWLGWFGFNAGSTLSLSDPYIVSLIVINTRVAASAGAVVAMIVAWIKFGKPDVSIAFNGVLAVLVGITASCAAVTPLAAVAIGAIAGVLVVLGLLLLDRLQIDDPVTAVLIHGLCGIWGTLAVGLWGLESLGAPGDGLFVGGGPSVLGIQAVGTIACLGFVAATMWITFKVIDVASGLRVLVVRKSRSRSQDRGVPDWPSRETGFSCRALAATLYHRPEQFELAAAPKAGGPATTRACMRATIREPPPYSAQWSASRSSAITCGPAPPQRSVPLLASYNGPAPAGADNVSRNRLARLFEASAPGPSFSQTNNRSSGAR